MNEFKFNTINDLYNKVKPALKVKIEDLKRNYITYIKEEDIWNYLKDKYWSKSNKLTLGEVVNDILNISNNELENYAKEELKNKVRYISKDDLL